jgi:hypothetical protein
MTKFADSLQDTIAAAVGEGPTMIAEDKPSETDQGWGLLAMRLRYRGRAQCCVDFSRQSALTFFFEKTVFLVTELNVRP